MPVPDASPIAPHCAAEQLKVWGPVLHLAQSIADGIEDWELAEAEGPPQGALLDSPTMIRGIQL